MSAKVSFLRSEYNNRRPATSKVSTISAPLDWWDWLDAVRADMKGYPSRSALIREAVEAYIEDYLEQETAPKG